MSCEEPETGGPSGDDPATFATTPPPPASSGLPKTPPPTNLQSAATTQSSGDKSTADEINLPMEELKISEEPETGESSGDSPATSVPTPPASSDLPTPSANLSSSAATQSSRVESKADKFISLADVMWGRLQDFKFDNLKTFNPAMDAKDTHDCFIRKYGNSTKSVLFLGMNPGPSKTGKHTGVPFADIETVEEWMKITVTAKVGETRDEPPKGGPRSGESGQRFWKVFKDLCGTPEKFFNKCFVYDYCPLMFLGENDKNVSLEKTKAGPNRDKLNGICDEFLCKLIELLEVKLVVGIGNYATDRTEKALGTVRMKKVQVDTIPHPSPINPASHEGWEKAVIETLNKFDKTFIEKYMSK